MNPSAITTRTPTVLLQAEQALPQWREVAGGPGFPIPTSAVITCALDQIRLRWISAMLAGGVF